MGVDMAYRFRLHASNGCTGLRGIPLVVDDLAIDCAVHARKGLDERQSTEALFLLSDSDS